MLVPSYTPVGIFGLHLVHRPLHLHQQLHHPRQRKTWYSTDKARDGTTAIGLMRASEVRFNRGMLKLGMQRVACIKTLRGGFCMLWSLPRHSGGCQDAC